MINFRFHIVSLTAVLLSLGVGLVLGTAFLDEAVVDALRGQLDGLEHDLDRSRERSDQMRQQISTFEDEHDALDEELEQHMLAGALAGQPVLAIASDGTDRDLVARLLAGLDSAGAQTLGVWRLTGDLALDDDDKVERVGQALDLSFNDAERIRDQLVISLSNVLYGVTDASLSADPEPASLIGRQDDPPPDGGAGEGGSGDADTNGDADDPYEPAVVAALREAGSIDYELPEAAEGDVIFLPRGGVRVVVLTEPGADVPNSLLVEILGSLASNGRVPVVVPAVLADPREEDEELPPGLVDIIRDDEALAARIATVDNLDRAVGKTATILALQAAVPGDPLVGHYGQGIGAERLLPPPPPAP